MATVLITGGTGLIGTALTRVLLDRGYHVIIMGRSKSNAAGGQHPNLRRAFWDPAGGILDAWAIAEADIIVNLAGAGVADSRWTRRRKQEILESRTRAADLLVQSLKTMPHHVELLLNASATGWYSPSPEEGEMILHRETEDADPGFLGSTCKAWESHIQPVAAQNIRLVIFRIGIVLSREGGALPEFSRPLRFGVAAILGSGKQYVPWIHIEDLCGMILMAIERKNMAGTFNAVAPTPVTNKILVLTLARTKRKYFLPVPVPALFLKIALGEMSIEVLKSVAVSAEKILAAGYEFRYPDIESALIG